MFSDIHYVHGATSEPGMVSKPTPREPNAGPESVKLPSASSELVDVTGLGKAKTRGRRIRVTNNLVSTVFSPDPNPSELDLPKTILRCSYNTNSTKSHENIFGGPDPNARTRSLVHRCEPLSDTQQNLFGDPLPSPVSTATHADTFDVLFGVPELIRNSRRPYEEDTHAKLFGESIEVLASVRDSRVNTQENIFGPPIVATPKVNSRPENTQEDLFGPPIPAKAGRVHPRDRSTLDLFRENVVADELTREPGVLTRAGRINAETHGKLFGDPPMLAPPPGLREDTSKHLFGALELDSTALIALYEDSKYNPITGEGHAEKHTAVDQVKPCAKRPPTPAPGTSAFDKAKPHPHAPKDGAALQLLIKRQRERWDKTNTITGDPTTYSPGSARKMES